MNCLKKLLCILLVCALTASLAACGDARSTATPTPYTTSDVAPVETAAVTTTPLPAGESNVLVAYFSWADNAIPAGDVDAVVSPSVVPPGNVQQLADWVQEATGGDLFSIRVTEPYPSDWDECLARANSERGEDARPELAENLDSLDAYDTIFLGYPNWWYGVPMALLSFLESQDFTGKQVYLFCSHGTGGLARSVEIIGEAIPTAQISDNIFDCYEEDAAMSESEIKAWIEELGYMNPAQPETRQIRVTCNGAEAVYELGDSPAANALYAQLPLTLPVEDFSTNEKIFYPPEELDTSDTPLASGGAGTLAYYAPWGDVVLFYDEYSANSSLYELGRIVSGGELVSGFSGEITVEAV